MVNLIKIKLCDQKGQSMVEYMLLLAVVMAIVLVGFKQQLPAVFNSSGLYFNRVAIGILGEPNQCGDGVIGSYETAENCCQDVGGC